MLVTGVEGETGQGDNIGSRVLEIDEASPDENEHLC
jgi:hypothetical protein